MGYSPTLGRWLEQDPLGTPNVSTGGLNNATGTDLTAPTMRYSGGINLYEALGSNPVNRTDPTGLLVDLEFNLATGELVATDRDTGEKVTLPAGCAFSGGVFGGKTYQAIPAGRYQVLERKPNADGTRGDWYILDPFDKTINNDKLDDGSNRGNFRLHPGTISHGCVTVKKDCQDAYDQLRKLISKTKKETVPYKPGWSTTNIDKYGNLIVVNNPPATQPTTQP